MNEEQKKEIVRRFVERLWNRRELDVADELISPDCITHQLRGAADAAGASRTPELVKREAQAWLAGFPDLRFEIEQMIAEEDRVASRLTLTGTHTGTWNGIPATNRKIALPMMTIHRIRDGKIVEDWVLVGTLILFQQLGMVPDTAEIVAAAAKR